MGAALKPYRDKVVIATKFGIHFDWSSKAVNLPVVTDSRPEVIRTSVVGTDSGGKNHPLRTTGA